MSKIIKYSAICAFSKDLSQVVMIHKLRPIWQLNKANFPGGKLEECDGSGFDRFDKCASRELREETGLDVDPKNLILFCILHFNGGECHFYYTAMDIYSAKTKETEHVFIGDVNDIIIKGTTKYGLTSYPVIIETMPNLSTLICIARRKHYSADKSIYEIFEREKHYD